MVLVDTTVWVDHLRAGDKALAATLDAGVTHPFVIGEIALGQLNPRDVILRTLSNLPKATVATDAEVLAFIDAYKLFGLGIGYVDVHLLAAVQPRRRRQAVDPGQEVAPGRRTLGSRRFGREISLTLTTDVLYMFHHSLSPVRASGCDLKTESGTTHAGKTASRTLTFALDRPALSRLPSHVMARDGKCDGNFAGIQPM